MSDVLSADDAREEEKAVMAALDNAYQGFNAPGTLEGARDSLLALARSHEQMRDERDDARETVQNMGEWLEESEAAARAGGCAADLAESWELSAERALARRLPEGDMVAERGKAAVFRTCARELRESVAVSGQTAEKEEA